MNSADIDRVKLSKVVVKLISTNYNAPADFPESTFVVESRQQELDIVREIKIRMC